MNHKLFMPHNLYFALWVLYFTQGIILPKGSFISKMVLLVYLAASLYYVIYAVVNYKLNGYFKALNVLLIMFTLYGLIDIIVYGGMEIVLPTRTVNSFDYLKLIYLSLLPTYPFYVFTKKQLIDESWTKRAFFLCFGVMILRYIMDVRMIMNSDSYKDEINQTINVGYQFVSMIPLLFFFKKKTILQYVLFAIILSVIVSTLKRGAILTAVVCFAYFIYTNVIGSKKNQRWHTIVLVSLLILVGSIFLVRFYENSQFAQLRLEQTMDSERSTSGRDQIYSGAWTTFTNSELFHKLFGYGAHGTVKILTIAAHNDWFELLVNQGLLGFFVYLCYWLSLFICYKKDSNKETKHIMGTVIIILFLSSLFSMSYGGMHLPTNICLGYCLAEQQRMKLNSNPCQ